MDKQSYVVCYAIDILSIHQQVDYWLKSGYICQGGISMCVTGPYTSFAQAMILNE